MSEKKHTTADTKKKNNIPSKIKPLRDLFNRIIYEIITSLLTVFVDYIDVFEVKGRSVEICTKTQVQEHRKKNCHFFHPFIHFF